MAPIYVLLSEGPDDVAVLYHLLNYHWIPLAPKGQRVESHIALEQGAVFRAYYGACASN